MLPISANTDRMNKTERSYANHLENLRLAGELMDWQFEPVGLRLSENKCYYHPDFLVLYEDHFEVHETKAFNKKQGKPLVKDDALVKIKVAASQFYFWKFKIVWWDSIQHKWDNRVLSS